MDEDPRDTLGWVPLVYQWHRAPFPSFLKPWPKIPPSPSAHDAHSRDQSQKGTCCSPMHGSGVAAAQTRRHTLCRRSPKAAEERGRTVLMACVSSCLLEGFTPGSFRTLAELPRGRKALSSYSSVISKLPGFPPRGGGGCFLGYQFHARARCSVFGN